MAETIGVHKLTSGPIAFDFARQKAFVDNPDMTITGVNELAAHDEAGQDVSAEAFDADDHAHQIDGLVVRVWVETPPEGVHKITLAVATLNDGVTGVEVYQSADKELPRLDVNGDGADA